MGTVKKTLNKWANALTAEDFNSSEVVHNNLVINLYQVLFLVSFENDSYGPIHIPIGTQINSSGTRSLPFHKRSGIYELITDCIKCPQIMKGYSFITLQLNQ